MILENRILRLERCLLGFIALSTGEAQQSMSPEEFQQFMETLRNTLASINNELTNHNEGQSIIIQ